MSTAVKVHIPASLRRLTGGMSDIEVEASTVKQLIAELETRFPGMAERLISENRLKPGLAVAVNSRLCAAGLTEPLPPGAEVQFVPAIAGG
jgi:sulfur-carrier protein